MSDDAWVKTSGTKSASVYHTDRDCRQLTAATNITGIDDELIEARDLRECRYCAGSVENVQRDEPTFAQRVRWSQQGGDA